MSLHGCALSRTAHKFRIYELWVLCTVCILAVVGWFGWQLAHIFKLYAIQSTIYTYKMRFSLAKNQQAQHVIGFYFTIIHISLTPYHIFIRIFRCSPNSYHYSQAATTTREKSRTLSIYILYDFTIDFNFSIWNGISVDPKSTSFHKLW